MPMFVHLEVDPSVAADVPPFFRRGRPSGRPRTELKLCPYEVL